MKDDRMGFGCTLCHGSREEEAVDTTLPGSSASSNSRLGSRHHASASASARVPKSIDWSVTSCGHVFHTFCITNRWRDYRRNESSIACPQCSQPCTENLINIFPSDNNNFDKNLGSTSTVRNLGKNMDELRTENSNLIRDQCQMTNKFMEMVKSRDDALSKLSAAQRQLGSSRTEIETLKRKLGPLRRYEDEVLDNGGVVEEPGASPQTQIQLDTQSQAETETMNFELNDQSREKPLSRNLVVEKIDIDDLDLTEDGPAEGASLEHLEKSPTSENAVTPTVAHPSNSTSAAAEEPTTSSSTITTDSTSNAKTTGTRKNSREGGGDSRKRAKSDLFENIIFYVTAGPQVHIELKIEEYTNLIRRAGGGRGGVCRWIGDEASTVKKHNDPVYLISDAHATTIEYLYCLAAGYPCLGIQWIYDCIKKKRIVEWLPYRLACGWSLEQRRLISADERPSLTALRNRVVCLGPDNQTTPFTLGGIIVKDWQRILGMTGAKVISRTGNLCESDGIHFVVADSQCPPKLLNQARAIGIPVVSAYWLIQTLILGDTPELDGHPDYKL